MKDRFGLSAHQEIKIEVYNAITHGIGAILSLVGLILLIFKAMELNHSPALLAYIIYGISMILLFTNSTLYHSFSFSKYRGLFQRLDHASIYLLIAGTYTPYLLLAISGPYRYIFLAIIWTLAIIGIVIEVGWINKFPKLSTWMYLGLGWIGIFIFKPLINQTNIWGIVLLLMGGLLYSFGTIFYKMKHNKWMHVIWHLFVLAAAGFMYFSILFYV